METIEIKTQVEFDALPDRFEVFTQIKITGINIIVIKAWDNATVEALGNATVEAWDNAKILYVSMNVIVRILSSQTKVIEARQNAVLVYQECDGEPEQKDRSVTINRTRKASFNLANFLKIYDVSQEEGKITLFKSVQENFTDFYTGKIKYEIGKEVECLDWSPNSDRECGGGLHLSPSIKHCKLFHNGRYLRCEVDLEDIVVHPSPRYPHKVRCRKVMVLEEVLERKEEL